MAIYGVLHSNLVNGMINNNSPFNVAHSFKRQIKNISYISPISNDIYGSRLMQFAKKEGITLPENTRSDLSTSLALVYKDEHGQPVYCLYR
jgi:fructokinase